MSLIRWWAARTPVQRGLAIAAAVIVACNLLLTGLGALVGREPGGPTASSYATGDDGLAALAHLYAGRGLRVDRLRRSLDDAALDPGSALVIAAPDTVLGADVRAVRRFVDTGGQVVVAGPTTLPIVRDLVDDDVQWWPVGPARSEVLAPVAEAGGSETVVADGGASWRSSGSGLPFLGRGSTTVGLVADSGAGRVVALADVSLLDNSHLGRAGNASLALGLVGDRRRVVFDEAGHGYQTGAGALPGRWLRASLVALLAVLIGMWSSARRLGPAEEEGRPLPPPRRGYVDALAITLSRTGEPAAAMAPLQRHARDRLTRRLGLGPDAGRAEVEAAAERAGLAAEDVAPLFDTPRAGADVVAVGRAAARHEGGAW